MINFLHSYHPISILVSFGFINIRYYGLFIALGTLAAMAVVLILAKHQQIKQEFILDIAFWLLIWGVIGARLYYVFLELPFYLNNPLNIFKIWNGGLAIHGAIIAGVLVIYWFCKKHQQNFWQLSAIIVISVPLAQAIGRWGNYFNQELFGKPTNLAWSIPIDLINRPWQYLAFSYFHPTFLYESIGNLIIFIILLVLYFALFKGNNLTANKYKLCVMGYLIMYSILRFFLEFLRIDSTPIILNLRFPQFISLLIFFFAGFYLIYVKKNTKKLTKL
ncbi:MAG: prolipoprotein diacylglyceryl transferase [Patescibacteria group bacterium]